MRKKYIVWLTSEERDQLVRLIATGREAASRLVHARILLKADGGAQGPGQSDAAIAEAVEVGTTTVERVRQRFAEGGLEAALGRRESRRVYAHKLDGLQEAHLIALTCSEPPEGRDRWTLRLLADRMVQLNIVDTLSKDTVYRTLKKTSLSPGRSSNGASRRRPTANSSGGWKTCWTCIKGRMTPSGR